MQLGNTLNGRTQRSQARNVAADAVRFACRKAVGPGQFVKIVGSDPALGELSARADAFLLPCACYLMRCTKRGYGPQNTLQEERRALPPYVGGV